MIKKIYILFIMLFSVCLLNAQQATERGGRNHQQKPKHTVVHKPQYNNHYKKPKPKPTPKYKYTSKPKVVYIYKYYPSHVSYYDNIIYINGHMYYYINYPFLNVCTEIENIYHHPKCKCK